MKPKAVVVSEWRNANYSILRRVDSFFFFKSYPTLYSQMTCYTPHRQHYHDHPQQQTTFINLSLPLLVRHDTSVLVQQSGAHILLSVEKMNKFINERPVALKPVGSLSVCDNIEMKRDSNLQPSLQV